MNSRAAGYGLVTSLRNGRVTGAVRWNLGPSSRPTVIVMGLLLTNLLSFPLTVPELNGIERFCSTFLHCHASQGLLLQSGTGTDREISVTSSRMGWFVQSRKICPVTDTPDH